MIQERPRHPSTAIHNRLISGLLPGCCVAMMGALNLVVFVGGIYLPELDMLANFAPGLVVVGLVALFLSRLAGSRYIVLAAFFCAVMPPAVVIGVDAIGALHLPVSESASRLKVMTLNLWSRNQNLSAAETLIQTERPNVLFLQETSSKGDRQFLERLKVLYPTHVSNDPINCATHIFSDLSLVEQIWRTADCDLVAARLSAPPQLGGGELLVASVHISRDLSRQVVDATALMTIWANQSAIVGGDFNRTPWTSSLRRFDNIPSFERRTHALPTWPTNLRAKESWLTMPFAVLPLDHVFATQNWRTISVRRGPVVGSDHYPVIVELSQPLQ